MRSPRRSADRDPDRPRRCSLWPERIEREAKHGAAGSAHAIALQDGESARKGFFGSRIIAAACRHGIFDTAAKQHSTEMIMCSLAAVREELRLRQREVRAQDRAGRGAVVQATTAFLIAMVSPRASKSSMPVRMFATLK